MTQKSEVEAFLAEILTLIVEKFGKKAVLRGGMVLRLLENYRFTNDLDFLFVPFASKKDVVKPILLALSELPETRITHQLNSQCLRVTLERGKSLTVQIEVKVDSECKTAILSTAPLAKSYNLIPRVISVMKHEVSLAHKLAAWNERRLIRDLYDTYLFLNMGIRPDAKVLLERLRNVSHARNIQKKLNFSTIEEFYKFLLAELSLLEYREIRQELSPLIPKDELIGLDLRMKTVITKAFLP